jgi:hypothetical protein
MGPCFCGGEIPILWDLLLIPCRFGVYSWLPRAFASAWAKIPRKGRTARNGISAFRHYNANYVYKLFHKKTTSNYSEGPTVIRGTSNRTCMLCSFSISWSVVNQLLLPNVTHPIVASKSVATMTALAEQSLERDSEWQWPRLWKVSRKRSSWDGSGHCDLQSMRAGDEYIRIL